MAISFDVLRTLLGALPVDRVVTEALAVVPDFRWVSDGGPERTGYSHAEGFSLRARPPRGAAPDAPARIETIVLKSARITGDGSFAAPPFGLSFGTRADLAALPPPKRTFVMGNGFAPRDTRSPPSHETWELDGLEVIVHYDRDARSATEAQVTDIAICRPDS
jgi:hypothetical protein